MLMLCAMFVIAAPPVSARVVLAESHSSLTWIHDIDYQVDVSLYPGHPIRFRASSVMTRYDADLPFGADPESKTRSTVNWAYDGATYQQRTEGSETLKYSSASPTKRLSHGPCLSPVEQCYLWLTNDIVGINWSVMRDPATWDALTPEPDVEPGMWNNIACLIVRLKLNDDWMTDVYFSQEHSYFPIRHVIYGIQGAIVKEVLASEIQAFQSESREIFLPLHVTCNRHQYMEQAASSLAYDIDHATVAVNSGIDPGIFDLRESEPSRIVHDLDGRRIFVDGDPKPIPAYNHPDVNLPTNTLSQPIATSHSSIRLWIIITINVAVLFVSAIIYIRCRER
jgi:hypothetical protein